MQKFFLNKNWIFKIYISLLIVFITCLVLFFLNSCNSETPQDSTKGQSGQAQQPTDSVLLKNTLTVGCDASFPPFSYLENETFEGFDVDIIKEIIKRLGKEAEIIETEWNPEFKNISDSGIDLQISAIVYDKEKETVVDFSKPYFTMNYLILSLVGSDIKKREELKDRNVGILDLGKEYLKEEYLQDYKISRYEDISKLLDSLKNKKIDGILLNLPLAVNLLKENMDMYMVLGEIESTEQFSIVFKKDSPLKAVFDPVIDEIHKDNKYNEIYNKWFGYNGF
jgi:polar amino acid transport system substrate-binding protein